MAQDTTMRCDCCGGDLPMQQVWEAYRSGDGDCDGSVDSDGRCRAYGDDAWAANEVAAAMLNYGRKFSGNNVADEAQEWLDHGEREYFESIRRGRGR